MLLDIWQCNPWSPPLLVSKNSVYCQKCAPVAARHRSSGALCSSPKYKVPLPTNYPLAQKHDLLAERRKKGLSTACKAHQGSQAAPEAEIPESREQAISQACEALAAQLTTERKRGKGYKGLSSKRLVVEVPVADTGPQATARLAADMLAGLPKQLASSFTLVFADVEAALSASDLVPNAVLSLDGCEGETAAGSVLFVGASAQQARAVDALLDRWRSRVAVALNADWAALTGRDAALAATFDVVYCFEPIAVKAFLLTTEGLVMRRAGGIGAADAPWFVYKRGGWAGAFKLIGRLPERPTAEDLELVFYNSSAAESPITQGIKAIRGLTGKGK